MADKNSRRMQTHTRGVFLYNMLAIIFYPSKIYEIFEFEKILFRGILKNVTV